MTFLRRPKDVLKTSVSAGPLIERLYLLFSILRLVLKSYEPRNLLDRSGKAYKILSEISNRTCSFIFYAMHECNVA